MADTAISSTRTSPPAAGTAVERSVGAPALWQEYQKSGLHLSAEEVDAWLLELEAGHDIEPPAPHP